jgi:peptide/nickel transport system substrate-binding protein
MKHNYLRWFIIIGIHITLFATYYTWKHRDVLFYDATPGLHQAAAPQESLVVTYRDHPESLDYISMDSTAQSFIHHIYEGLVSFDKNLNIKPQLALSWGLIDDTTWRFILRPNVYFHNGDEFTADDILETFDWVNQNNDSPIKSRLSTIEKIEKVTTHEIIIKTINPDPVLLQKLTDFYIAPISFIKRQKAIADKTFLAPIGTGPLKFSSWGKGEFLKLVNFDQYYLGQPPYGDVVIESLPNKFARYRSVQNAETDILVDVPSEFIEQIQNDTGYKIVSLPRLESVFLLFNFESEVFNNRLAREALLKILDYEEMKKILGNYGKRVTQFIPSGVFGYNPVLPPILNDDQMAQQLASRFTSKESPRRVKLVLDSTNERFGFWIQEQLHKINIKTDLQLVDPSDLLGAMEQGVGDIYLVGWHFAEADAFQFYHDVIHSRQSQQVVDVSSEDESEESFEVTGESSYGLYNLSYVNKQVDLLIEKSEKELDQKARLELIQEITDIILTKDIIGVPLFRSYQNYAVSPDVEFSPRIDTLIHFPNTF